MATQILVSDFSEYALENYNTFILQEAKQICTDKMRFYNNEINNGHCDASTIERYNYWRDERLKWIPIIIKAKERDREREAKFEAFFK